MIYRVTSSCVQDGADGAAYFTNKRDAEREARCRRRDYRELLTEYRDEAAARGSCPPDEPLAWWSVDIGIETSPTPRNKREVVALLQRWGSHPDNG